MRRLCTCSHRAIHGHSFVNDLDINPRKRTNYGLVVNYSFYVFKVRWGNAIFPPLVLLEILELEAFPHYSDGKLVYPSFPATICAWINTKWWTQDLRRTLCSQESSRNCLRGPHSPCTAPAQPAPRGGTGDRQATLRGSPLAWCRSLPTAFCVWTFPLGKCVLAFAPLNSSGSSYFSDVNSMPLLLASNSPLFVPFPSRTPPLPSSPNYLTEKYSQNCFSMPDLSPQPQTCLQPACWTSPPGHHTDLGVAQPTDASWNRPWSVPRGPPQLENKLNYPRFLLNL